MSENDLAIIEMCESAHIIYQIVLDLCGTVLKVSLITNNSCHQCK